MGPRDCHRTQMLMGKFPVYIYIIFYIISYIYIKVSLVLSDIGMYGLAVKASVKKMVTPKLADA